MSNATTEIHRRGLTTEGASRPTLGKCSVLALSLTTLSLLQACTFDENLGTLPGPTSYGTYRAPYADGTEYVVLRSFADNEPLGTFDFMGLSPNQPIVAAADGWIRFIRDSTTDQDAGQLNYVWIEHPYPFCQPEGVTWSGMPANYADTCITATCVDGSFGPTGCNEWTKYANLAPGSVQAEGLVEGQFVAQGTRLGFEGARTDAGPSLEWEVAVLDPTNPLVNFNNGSLRDWPSDPGLSEYGWAHAPRVDPTLCYGIHGSDLIPQDAFFAMPCPAPLIVDLGVTWDLTATTAVTGTAALSYSIAPDGSRATVHDLRVKRGTKITVQKSGLPLPAGTRVTVENTHLARPVSFALDAKGHGKFQGSEALMVATLVITPPGAMPSPSKPTKINGAMTGTVSATFAAGKVSFEIDAGAFGKLKGASKP